MSELSEILTSDGGDWAEAVVSGAATVTDAELSRMDLQAAFDDALARVWDADAPVPLAAGRRHRRLVASLALAGVLVGATGAAAATTSYLGDSSALSGLFGQPGKTENDTSEIVNLGAPDFPTVARQLAAQLQAQGLRFAPGYDAQKNIDATIGRLAQPNIQTDVTGVKGWIAEDAACTWQRSWLQADEQHDRSGMNLSAAGMRQTAELKIMSQINDATWQAGLAEDADRGNAAPIQRQVTLNCPTAIQ